MFLQICVLLQVIACQFSCGFVINSLFNLRNNYFMKNPYYLMRFPGCIRTMNGNRFSLLLNARKRSNMNNNNQRNKSSSAVENEEDKSAATMACVSQAATKAMPSIVTDLKTKGWAVIDNFLQNEKLSTQLRNEAHGYFKGGDMILSQSTRFDPSTGNVITYNKHNVFSMQLQGGELYYKGPRLHEYCVSMVKTVVPLLSKEFPEANLCPVMVSNKLAVCIGEGSAYDKHYDNSGLDDTRKVTILYYMNFNWKPEHGGYFRIYNLIGSEMSTVDIEPIVDRLLIFWSDRLVHSVEPSYAPQGEPDYRYALTLWITAKTPEDIVRDDAEVARHFGTLCEE